MSAPDFKKQKITAVDASAIAPDRGERCRPISLWADLPVTAWGRALDYLRYSEARNALLVSKFMAAKVPKHVQTLNIFAAAEMHARMARRFPNCNELNILCLLVEDDEDSDDEQDPGKMPVLIEDVLHRVVPFLTFFPKLKNVFIGGVWNSTDKDKFPTIEYTERDVYSSSGCTSPENHDSLYRYLVQSISGMYASGALKPKVSIKGIYCGRGTCCTEDVCVCRRVCRSFPFGALTPSASSDDNETAFRSDFCFGAFSCLSMKERVGIIKGRLGGLQYIRSLTRNLEACLSAFSYECQSIHWHPAGHHYVYYLDKRNVEYIESLVECGHDPSTLSREVVLDRMQKYRSREDSPLYWMRHFVAKTALIDWLPGDFQWKKATLKSLMRQLILTGSLLSLMNFVNKVEKGKGP